MKPSWDDYFLNLAVAVSARSSCPRASVGAVLVDKFNRVISVGYNGAEAGVDECIDVGCAIEDGHCTRAVHAEENAIVYAIERNGFVSLIGSKLYTTVSCCPVCEEFAKEYGVEEFHSLIKYGDHLPLDLKECTYNDTFVNGDRMASFFKRMDDAINSLDGHGDLNDTK